MYCWATSRPDGSTAPIPVSQPNLHAPTLRARVSATTTVRSYDWNGRMYIRELAFDDGKVITNEILHGVKRFATFLGVGCSHKEHLRCETCDKSTKALCELIADTLAVTPRMRVVQYCEYDSPGDFSLFMRCFHSVLSVPYDLNDGLPPVNRFVVCPLTDARIIYNKLTDFPRDVIIISDNIRRKREKINGLASKAFNFIQRQIENGVPPSQIKISLKNLTRGQSRLHISTAQSQLLSEYCNPAKPDEMDGHVLGKVVKGVLIGAGVSLGCLGLLKLCELTKELVKTVAKRASGIETVLDAVQTFSGLYEKIRSIAEEHGANLLILLFTVVLVLFSCMLEHYLTLKLLLAGALLLFWPKIFPLKFFADKLINAVSAPQTGSSSVDAHIGTGEIANPMLDFIVSCITLATGVLAGAVKSTAAIRAMSVLKNLAVGPRAVEGASTLISSVYTGMSDLFGAINEGMSPMTLLRGGWTATSRAALLKRQLRETLGVYNIQSINQLTIQQLADPNISNPLGKVIGEMAELRDLIVDDETMLRDPYIADFLRLTRTERFLSLFTTITAVNAAQQVRVTPMAFWLYSEPGFGKSTIMPHIVYHCFGRKVPIYNRSATDAYWSGYNGTHAATIYDDVDSMEIPANGMTQSQEIADKVTSNSTMLNMASIDERSAAGCKGQTFVSTLIGCASNRQVPNDSGVSSKKAMLRRFPFAYRIVRKDGRPERPDFRNYEGSFVDNYNDKVEAIPYSLEHEEVPYESKARISIHEMMDQLRTGFIEHLRNQYNIVTAEVENLPSPLVHVNAIDTAGIGEDAGSFFAHINPLTGTMEQELLEDVRLETEEILGSSLYTDPANGLVETGLLDPNGRCNCTTSEERHTETHTLRLSCIPQLKKAQQQPGFLDRIRSSFSMAIVKDKTPNMFKGSRVLAAAAVAALVVAIGIGWTLWQKKKPIEAHSNFNNDTRSRTSGKRRPNLVGRSLFDAHVGDVPDGQDHNIMQKIRAATLRISCDGEEAWGFAPCGRMLFVNSHIARMWKDKTVQIEKGGKLFCTVVMDESTAYSFQDPSYGTSELSVITLPIWVEQFRDLTGHFTDGDMADNTFAAKRVYPEEYKRVMTSVEDYGVANAPHKDLILNIPDGTKQGLSEGTFFYLRVPLARASHPGDCGIPLIMKERGQIKICGMVCGGNRKEIVAAVSLNKSQPLYMVEYLAMAIGKHRVQNVNEVGRHPMPEGNFKKIGYLNIRPELEGKNKAVPSVMKDLLGTTDSAPSITSDSDERWKQYVSRTIDAPLTPRLASVRKYGTFPERCYDRRLLDIVADGYIESVLDEINFMPSNVLSQEQVLNGCEENGFRIKSLPMDTSPGFPYTTKNLTREVLFPLVDGERTMGPEVGHNIMRRLQLAATGRVPVSIWTCCAKHEVLPAKKIAAGKVRTFSVPPVDYQVLGKMVFSSADAALKATSYIHTNMALGLSCESPDFSTLGEWLSEEADRFLAIDYRAFDGSILPELIEKTKIFYQRYHAEYAMTQQQRADINMIISCLFEELYRTTERCEDAVYETQMGNPSGCPITSVLNSITNAIIWRYAVARYMQDEGVTEYSEAYFRKVCRLIVLGDDAVAGFKDFHCSNADLLVYARELHCFPEIEAEGQKLSDMVFLKRRWQKTEANLRNKGVDMIGKIEMDSIRNILNWDKTAKEDPAIIFGKMYCALILLFGHGGATFKDGRRAIVQQMTKLYMGEAADRLPTWKMLTQWYTQGGTGNWKLGELSEDLMQGRYYSIPDTSEDRIEAHCSRRSQLPTVAIQFLLLFNMEAISGAIGAASTILPSIESMAKADPANAKADPIDSAGQMVNSLTNLAGVALSAFGLDDKRSADYCRNYRELGPSLANADTTDHFERFSIHNDAMQVSEKDHFGSCIDEQKYFNIVQKPVRFIKTKWSISDTPGTILASFPLTPTFGTAAYNANEPRANLAPITAVGYISQLHRWWRGSLAVRVTIVASRLHRGMLHFGIHYGLQEPSDLLGLTLQNATNVYGEYINLTDGVGTATINIPYQSNWNYLSNPLYDRDCLDTTAAGYNDCTKSMMGMGVLSVINPLSGNPGVVSSTIDVNLFGSGGPDFCVYMPVDARTVAVAPFFESLGFNIKNKQNKPKTDHSIRNKQNKPKTDHSIRKILQSVDEVDAHVGVDSEGMGVRMTTQTTSHISEQCADQMFTLQKRHLTEPSWDTPSMVKKRFYMDSIPWTDADPAGTNIKSVTFPSDFTNHPSTTQKLPFDRFTYFTGNLVIDFVVNTAPTAAGACVAVWLPLIERLHFEAFYSVNSITTMRHVYLDAGSGSTARLVVPFISPIGALSCAAVQQTSGQPLDRRVNYQLQWNLGRVMVYVFNPLTGGTGPPTKGNISFSAYITDSNFSIPRIPGAYQGIVGRTEEDELEAHVGATTSATVSVKTPGGPGAAPATVSSTGMAEQETKINQAPESLPTAQDATTTARAKKLIIPSFGHFGGAETEFRDLLRRKTLVKVVPLSADFASFNVRWSDLYPFWLSFVQASSMCKLYRGSIRLVVELTHSPLVVSTPALPLELFNALITLYPPAGQTINDNINGPVLDQLEMNDSAAAKTQGSNALASKMIGSIAPVAAFEIPMLTQAHSIQFEAPGSGLAFTGAPEYDWQLVVSMMTALPLEASGAFNLNFFISAGDDFRVGAFAGVPLTCITNAKGNNNSVQAFSNLLYNSRSVSFRE